MIESLCFTGLWKHPHGMRNKRLLTPEGRAPKDHTNIRILQAMMFGFPLTLLGLGTRMSDPDCRSMWSFEPLEGLQQSLALASQPGCRSAFMYSGLT